MTLTGGFMTYDGAVKTAEGAADRFGKPFWVFRCADWAPGEFRVIADDGTLPAGAALVGPRIDPGSTRRQPLDARAHLGDGDRAAREAGALFDEKPRP